MALVNGHGREVRWACTVVVAAAAIAGIALTSAGERDLGRVLIGLAVVTCWVPVLLARRA